MVMFKYRIIHRYIFKELWAPFLLNLTFFTFVFLMSQILEITKLIVNYNVGLGVVGRMLMYSIPFILVFVIPISVMITILLTFMRMSGDNEITAIKNGGISVYGLLPPVALFCVLAYLGTLWLSLVAVPWGKTSIKTLARELAATNIEIGLKERTFNDRLKDVVLYVNGIDTKTRKLIDVFIEDQRVENTVSTVVAPEGRLYSDPQRKLYQLRLYNGIINQVDIKNRSAHTINFESYDIVLDAGMLMGLKSFNQKRTKSAGEMTTDEYRQWLNDYPERNNVYYLALARYYQRYSIPFACISLGILALPLGVQLRSTRQSFGLIFGLSFFLIYYVLLSIGLVFGEAGVLAPVIGMWMPNLVVGAFAVIILQWTVKEKPLPIDTLRIRFENLIKKFH
jgi:lipopolysaccharide export system permease protein